MQELYIKIKGDYTSGQELTLSVRDGKIIINNGDCAPYSGIAYEWEYTLDELNQATFEIGT